MKSASTSRREDGVALIVCLLMMLVILMLGTSGAQIAIQEEKASRHERDRLMAFQAAEAALKDAEFDIERLPRVQLFESESRDVVAGQCEADLGNPLLGLCHPAASDMFPVWQRIGPGPQTVAVPFGYFTGRSLAASGNAAPPGYLIEVLADSTPPGDRAGGSTAGVYRITAIGYGSNERTQVVLQSYFRKSTEGQWSRLGWREILNWEEMREALEGK